MLMLFVNYGCAPLFQDYGMYRSSNNTSSLFLARDHSFKYTRRNDVLADDECIGQFSMAGRRIKFSYQQADSAADGYKVKVHSLQPVGRRLQGDTILLSLYNAKDSTILSGAEVQYLGTTTVVAIEPLRMPAKVGEFTIAFASSPAKVRLESEHIQYSEVKLYLTLEPRYIRPLCPTVPFKHLFYRNGQLNHGGEVLFKKVYE